MSDMQFHYYADLNPRHGYGTRYERRYAVFLRKSETQTAFQVRRFTTEEDDWIVEYELRGYSHAEIGRRLGRKPNSIKGRLATLARREERALAATEKKQ
jgi:DNA-directed RNA polymerase specialized sigma24 family protein